MPDLPSFPRWAATNGLAIPSFFFLFLVTLMRFFLSIEGYRREICFSQLLILHRSTLSIVVVRKPKISPLAQFGTPNDPFSALFRFLSSAIISTTYRLCRIRCVLDGGIVDGYIPTEG